MFKSVGGSRRSDGQSISQSYRHQFNFGLGFRCKNSLGVRSEDAERKTERGGAKTDVSGVE